MHTMQSEVDGAHKFREEDYLPQLLCGEAGKVRSRSENATCKDKSTGGKEGESIEAYIVASQKSMDDNRNGESGHLQRGHSKSTTG